MKSPVCPSIFPLELKFFSFFQNNPFQTFLASKTYIFINVKINSPLTAGGGGFKAIAEASSKNAFFCMLLYGSRKKSSFLSGRAIKMGGGVKGRAIKEKITFFVTFFFQSSKISTAIKLCNPV